MGSLICKKISKIFKGCESCVQLGKDIESLCEDCKFLIQTSDSPVTARQLCRRCSDKVSDPPVLKLSKKDI